MSTKIPSSPGDERLIQRFLRLQYEPYGSNPRGWDGMNDGRSDSLAELLIPLGKMYSYEAVVVDLAENAVIAEWSDKEQRWWVVDEWLDSVP